MTSEQVVGRSDTATKVGVTRVKKDPGVTEFNNDSIYQILI